MSELKDRLRSDLTTAIRGRDEVATATLRMALAAITTEEVAGSDARELSDDEVLKVLAREAKKRREAAEAFGVGRTGRSWPSGSGPRARCWSATCRRSSTTPR